MVERRSRRRWVYTATAIAGAVPLVLLPPLLLPAGSAGAGERILIVSGCALAGLVWALWFGTRAFLAEDEFVQQGSKFAWYWGAMSGVVLSAPVYVFIQSGGLHWLDPAIPVSKALGHAFALGYGLLLGAQLLGFLAVSLWWRLSKR